MAFRGLFIGIDRYASRGIDELTCARRDAVALEALFADTLGGTTRLLADVAATRKGIEAAFAELASCDAENTVVIAFSGHGSETHELVTHDADLADLPNTAIPLELLQEWFSKIPAQRLVLILDLLLFGRHRCESAPCCDQAAEHLVHRRAAEPTGRRRPDHLHGIGGHRARLRRPPLWPRVPDALPHGALRGAEEAVQGGKLSLYRLLSHVTNRVKAAAALIGRQQNPTMRGIMDVTRWTGHKTGALSERSDVYPARS
jgi:hypothetical protein